MTDFEFHYWALFNNTVNSIQSYLYLAQFLFNLYA